MFGAIIIELKLIREKLFAHYQTVLLGKDQLRIYECFDYTGKEK